jgi:TatD DNase family protein
MQSREYSSTHLRPTPEEPPPASAVRLFDAHCHLQDDCFSGRVEETIARAKERHVASMMCCGCREDDWDRVLELSCQEGVFVSFGLHPWYVGKQTPRWLERLRRLLDDVPFAGVGEIGLDYAVHDDFTGQEEVFVRQLRLAAELRRPVSIHCRQAFGRMVELMKLEGGVKQGGLVHSYSGSTELVPVFERMGMYISFSGTITHTNNKRARKAVTAVSKDRLLIETDSPDLPPAGLVAGSVNEPAHLPLVLETAARLIGLSARETAKLTFDNAQRLFGVMPTARSAEPL